MTRKPCLSVATVSEFTSAPFDVLEQLTKTLEQATGYSIQKQILQLSGMCADRQ